MKQFVAIINALVLMVVTAICLFGFLATFNLIGNAA